MGGVHRWLTIVVCWVLCPFQAVGLTVQTAGKQEPGQSEQVPVNSDSELPNPVPNPDGSKQYNAMQPYGTQPYSMQPYNPYQYSPQYNWLYPTMSAVSSKAYKTIVKEANKKLLHALFKKPKHEKVHKLSDTSSTEGSDDGEDEDGDENNNDEGEDQDKGEVENRKQGFAVSGKKRATTASHKHLDKRHYLKKASKGSEVHKSADKESEDEEENEDGDVDKDEDTEEDKEEDKEERREQASETKDGHAVPGLPAPGPIENTLPAQPMLGMPLAQQMPSSAQPFAQQMPSSSQPTQQMPAISNQAQPMPPVGQPLSPYGPYFPPGFMPSPQAGEFMPPPQTDPFMGLAPQAQGFMSPSQTDFSPQDVESPMPPSMIPPAFSAEPVGIAPQDNTAKPTPSEMEAAVAKAEVSARLAASVAQYFPSAQTQKAAQDAAAAAQMAKSSFVLKGFAKVHRR